MTVGLPQYENILIAPVLHYQLEFADAVRRLIQAWQPSRVAVELPGMVEAGVRRGVARLPELSVLGWAVADQVAYLPIEPCDALIEAVRSARERDLPVHFVDLDQPYTEQHREPFPDSYVVYKLGWGRIWEEYQRACPSPASSAADARRETHMAYQLQQLAADGERVLLVCGMAHVAGILARLPVAQAQVLARRLDGQPQLANVHPDSAREIMATTPFVSAVYERRRRGLPQPAPRRQWFETEHATGLRLMSSGLQTASRQQEERARLQSEVARQCGRQPDDCWSPLDRQACLAALVQAARASYEVNTGETMAPATVRVMAQFTRNYAMLRGGLLPDLYQLIVGARGVADDNFAYELWDLGSEWPWQTASSELPTFRFTVEQIWGASQRFAIRPRAESTKHRLHAVRLKQRKGERRPGEWRNEFLRGHGICSYPPEDLVIEEFGDHLKRRSREQLADEEARVEPFSTSLMDGIDIRETLRNWHLDRKLFVRELRRGRGEVGSVVVIFDEDDSPLGERYPWRMTWQGEHNQESDMALYATPLGRQLVGPGISRCEYGGFLMSYPPGRMFDVWGDPDYLPLRRKSELLLVAGLEYSEHKHVVYVAAKPPRSQFQTLANRLGRQIVYLPIGGFSPVTLKQLRVFHVLSDHGKRDAAPEYIW